MKKLWVWAMAMIVLSSTMWVFAETPEITSTDKDGYILYNFCSSDAKLLMLSKKNASESIQIAKEGSTVTMTFTEHVLSCGTHMNGTIKETKKDGKYYIQGDFNVTNNPYKIKKLLINIVNDLSAKTMTGTLTIDGKECDVNLLK